MTVEESVQQLRDLGYAVGVAFQDEENMIYRIEGFGVSIQASSRDSDADTWATLLDPHLHQWRVMSFENAQSPDDPPHTPHDVMAQQLLGLVDLGMMTQAKADEALVAFDSMPAPGQL